MLSLPLSGSFYPGAASADNTSGTDCFINFVFQKSQFG